MPTAVPTIPPSASGVSMTRSAPNSSWRPCVARKTPPNLPTSSPSTTTSGSFRISSRSASFTAWMMFMTGMASPSGVGVARVRDPRVGGDRRLQLLALLALLAERLGVHVLEHRRDGRLRREGLRLAERGLDLLADLLAEPRVGGLVERLAMAEVPLHALDRVLALPRLDQLRRPVGARVVGGGVALYPVRHALEERRALARGGAGPRAPGRGVDGEEV